MQIYQAAIAQQRAIPVGLIDRPVKPHMVIVQDPEGIDPVFRGVTIAQHVSDGIFAGNRIYCRVRLGNGETTPVPPDWIEDTPDCLVIGPGGIREQ